MINRSGREDWKAGERASMLASSSCFLVVEYVEDLVVEEDGSLEQSEVEVDGSIERKDRERGVLYCRNMWHRY